MTHPTPDIVAHSSPPQRKSRHYGLCRGLWLALSIPQDGPVPVDKESVLGGGHVMADRKQPSAPSATQRGRGRGRTFARFTIAR